MLEPRPLHNDLPMVVSGDVVSLEAAACATEHMDSVRHPVAGVGLGGR